MKATKYNKRAGKRTRVIRIKTTVSGPIYFRKDCGIVHMMGSPYVFWKAIPDISYTALRDWATRITTK